MDKETEKKWIEAGRIGSAALHLGARLIKPGIKLVEIAEKVEQKIIEMGCKPAFPCNISRNDLASHYTPPHNDREIFEEGDIVKLDVGAHIDGHISDNATTIDLGNNYPKLVKASREAVNNAIKILKPGLEIREIGKVIYQTIIDNDAYPITNLSGHGIDIYKQHAVPGIPNYDNKNENTLKEDQVIAIEPFATLGNGSVGEGAPSGIYKIETLRPVRSDIARQVLKFISEEYKTLPFAKRWVVKKFGSKGNLGMALLEREGILYSYPQLPELSKSIVSQAEHTIIIKDKPIVTTISD